MKEFSLEDAERIIRDLSTLRAIFVGTKESPGAIDQLLEAADIIKSFDPHSVIDDNFRIAILKLVLNSNERAILELVRKLSNDATISSLEFSMDFISRKLKEETELISDELISKMKEASVDRIKSENKSRRIISALLFCNFAALSGILYFLFLASK